MYGKEGEYGERVFVKKGNNIFAIERMSFVGEQIYKRACLELILRTILDWYFKKEEG